jgi:hypothetical protein
MKLTILILVGCTVSFTSCKKTNTDCSLIPAKIIRYDCDRVIFQLQSPASIGDTTWTDVQTGLQYSNVVSFYNTCKIAELTKGELKTIYIKPDLINQVPDGSCYQCLAVSQNPPQTKIGFTEISLSGCENVQNR